MSKLALYHYPGACSNVCVVALEEANLDYEMRPVDLSRGEQSRATYLAVVPLGKVPALQSPDGLVTENAAILTYIHGLGPDAGIFPASDSPIMMARRQAGLSFCGGNLHPIVRGMINPARMTEGYSEGVRAMSNKLARKSFAFAEAQLAENGYWLDDWSIIDVYLDWALSVARKAGYDLSPFPALDTLRDRLAQRPAYLRMHQINKRVEQELGRVRGRLNGRCDRLL